MTRSVLVPIPYRDPTAAFAPFAGGEGAVLLDSAAEAGGRGRWSYVCVRPRRVVLDPADPFAALDTLAAALPRRTVPADAPPFTGGIVGWLGYEAGRHLERLPAPRPDDLGVPEAAFGLYDTIAAFDTATGRAWACAPTRSEAEALANALGTAPLPPPDWTATAPWTAEQDPADAQAHIRAAIEFILAGDIFQANITQRFLATLPAGLDAFTLYRRLRALSPAPFAACASFGGAHLLSASPERFLRVEPGGRVETRPIKGTRRRGATPAEDAALAAELQASDKDRAENLMIVDLMRNDLARVCRVGSVAVPVLNGLETFASVHHLVSVVEGVLEDGRGPVDLLRAAFPGGSITGAPKIRAMEIIHALEPARRGPYCGTLFRLGADGAFDSSILIRSLVIGRTGTVAAQAGGGITADSDPAAEVAEARVKVAPLLAALGGEM